MSTDALPQRLPPHNFEAEQALLGALLLNNKAYERVSEFLRPEHFAHAAHGRIFAAAGRLAGASLGRGGSAPRSAAELCPPPRR